MENHRGMLFGGTKCIQMGANHCKTLFCTSLKWFPSLPCARCKLSMIFHKNLMGNHRIPSLQALRILTVRQAQLGSAQLDSARLSSAELRSARLGSTRLISARARAQPRHKSTPFPPALLSSTDGCIHRVGYLSNKPRVAFVTHTNLAS